MRTRAAAERGISLLETMIAMSLLLIGLLGLARLQVLGLTANEMARSYTRAEELARQLASGLEQLPFADARLNAAGTAGATPPVPFGSLQGVTTTTGVHTLAEGVPPGVAADPCPGFNMYKCSRRWTVWDYTSNNGTVATKLIAVSVVYRERWIELDHETTVYLQKANPAAVFSNAAAYR
jgi:type IV pilus assembly protein PilV